MEILRFLDFLVFRRVLDWLHFCSPDGRDDIGSLDAALHIGRVVDNLSNSKRRRLVKNSAFAFRYFGSRHSAVKSFGFSDDPDAPLATSFAFSDCFFSILISIVCRRAMFCKSLCLK